VYLVRASLSLPDHHSPPPLLRSSCDGPYLLNHWFAPISTVVTPGLNSTRTVFPLESLLLRVNLWGVPSAPAIP